MGADNTETFMLIFLGFLIGVIFVLGILLITGQLENQPSQETLDDICINFSGNQTATGSIDMDGKLVCEIPSFDSTHNIIIKETGQDG